MICFLFLSSKKSVKFNRIFQINHRALRCHVSITERVKTCNSWMCQIDKSTTFLVIIQFVLEDFIQSSTLSFMLLCNFQDDSDKCLDVTLQTFLMMKFYMMKSLWFKMTASFHTLNYHISRHINVANVSIAKHHFQRDQACLDT